MQRVACRYRRGASASSLNHGEMRALWLAATQSALLPISDSRRAVLLGPPLPAGATSEDERVVLELTEPRDPAEVSDRLSPCLPPGVEIELVWIALPGRVDEQPAALDEAVYDLLWSPVPDVAELAARIEGFLRESEVPFTRKREKKVQQLNARALVGAVHLLDSPPGVVCLRMTLSVGPLGSMRPDEVLQVLGYPLAPSDLGIHRISVQQAAWRHAAASRHVGARWRRQQ